MNRIRLGALTLAAAIILIWPSVSLAQRFWGGGGRWDGGWRGRTAYYYGDGGYRGAWGYGRGYNPYYYGPQVYDSGYASPVYSSSFQQPGYRSAAYPPDSAFDTMPADQGARVLANIRVPEASAQLWIEGQEMTPQGLVRSFVSPPLDPGARYTYTIRAQWTDNGKQVEATREVPVRPGQRVMVDFTAPQKGPAPRSQRRSGYGPGEGAATPRNEEIVTPPSDPEKTTPRREEKATPRRDEGEKATPQRDEGEKATPRRDEGEKATPQRDEDKPAPPKTKPNTPPPPPPERPRDNPPDDKQPPE